MPLDGSVGGLLVRVEAKLAGDCPVFIPQFCLVSVCMGRSRCLRSFGLGPGGGDFLSQFVQALLELMSLGLKAESNLE